MQSACLGVTIALPAVGVMHSPLTVVLAAVVLMGSTERLAVQWFNGVKVEQFEPVTP